MGDLIEYTQPGFAFQNRQNRFIFVLIDTFSKVVYTRAIKRKDKFSMSIALESMLSELQYHPNTIITDEGLEFYNKDVRKVLDNYGIHHYSIKTKMKSSIVERVIQTFKGRFEKYFYKNHTKKWIDILPQITSNYNKTPHRSIGMAPIAVTENNAPEVFQRLYPDINLEVKPRLSLGNIVRIIKSKTLFDKGYKQNWSEELYKIIQVKSVAGRTWYKIADLSKNILPGIKYYWQLTLVSKDDSELTFERDD